jgi:hypothetical protein
MATLAKKQDGAYGPIPNQQLRQGWTMPVGDTVFPESVEALTPFMTPQPGDTPAQVQIKVGLKTAVTFLDQCQGNVSEAMTSFFQDVRAFFRAMMPSENDDLTHNYGIVVGFFAGLFFCTRQGVAWGRSLLEQCLHEALEMTKKVLQWLQNEELQQSQAMSQDRRTRFQGA